LQRVSDGENFDRLLVRYRTRKKELNDSPSLFYKLPKTAKFFLVVGDLFMNTGVSKGLDAQSWKDLYQAAIHESDLNKLPERITDAETALMMRMREFSYASGDKFEEEESLDDAMCILHALRSSLKHRPSSIQRTSDLDYPKSA
jgi:hypothetical protein